VSNAPMMLPARFFGRLLGNNRVRTCVELVRVY